MKLFHEEIVQNTKLFNNIFKSQNYDNENCLHKLSNSSLIFSWRSRESFFLIKEWVTKPKIKRLISVELSLEHTSTRCDNFCIYEREKWQKGTIVAIRKACVFCQTQDIALIHHISLALLLIFHDRNWHVYALAKFSY